MNSAKPARIEGQGCSGHVFFHHPKKKDEKTLAELPCWSSFCTKANLFFVHIFHSHRTQMGPLGFCWNFGLVLEGCFQPKKRGETHRFPNITVGGTFLRFARSILTIDFGAMRPRKRRLGTDGFSRVQEVFKKPMAMGFHGIFGS